ncbi:MAG: bifunctional hydroxymethylpyrimidine kinase/phosphomethylpyrimidine kinase [Candidatus Latescibacterota bacterium]|nr:MAG: bifunctional hydroxymethylpyrimidine kinase/phosphomethylpyrimidine kinase [Candidatus Latescibacterota bacterium]
MRVILSIAGSDSSAGAGIQADLKAITACGGYAASVITAVTAQNTQGVRDAYELPTALIESQIDAIFEDLEVAAVKTGMLSSARVVESVARALRRRAPAHYVLDPVMISKSGHALLDTAAFASLKDLFALATLVTPNRHEAQALTGIDVRNPEDSEKAGRQLIDAGCRAVLVKGGHLDEHAATDVLVTSDAVEVLEGARIDTPHTHGTGCTYSAAIATYLGRGFALSRAVRAAKTYITEAIRSGLALGRGHGPTDHFFYLRRSDPLAWMERLGVTASAEPNRRPEQTGGGA